MKNIIQEFKVTDGKKFSLKDYDTGYKAGYHKDDAVDVLKELITQISDKQTELYAANKYALLIIFQAMDAAGKDSAIAHSMSGINPQGCQVYSFKQPSSEDYDHDFLWRHYKALPERGRIGIHNRSHYENVLVSRVHPEFLLNEQLPGLDTLQDVKNLKKKFWEKRYDSIRHFEDHLTANGTAIIKFFLHVSPEEQKKRFIKRIDDPGKNWKFSAADIKERQHWDEYMEAYQDAISATATDDSPWYVIPADKKWFTRIAISSVILHTLAELKLQYPKLPEEEADKLQTIKKQLEAEK